MSTKKKKGLLQKIEDEISLIKENVVTASLPIDLITSIDINQLPSFIVLSGKTYKYQSSSQKSLYDLLTCESLCGSIIYICADEDALEHKKLIIDIAKVNEKSGVCLKISNIREV